LEGVNLAAAYPNGESVSEFVSQYINSTRPRQGKKCNAREDETNGKNQDTSPREAWCLCYVSKQFSKEKQGSDQSRPEEQSEA
jgi:hypothetical protein